MHTALNVLVSLCLAYVALCGAVYLFQRSMIYFPTPAGAAPSRRLELQTDAGPLFLSTRPVGGPNALIYFGGNAEDVSLSLPEFVTAFPRHAIFLLHYRGYGGSAGRPSEQALFADALLLFDHVHVTHPNVAIIGRSVGSGVAVYVASLRPAARLVLVTPFDSLQAVAAYHYPYFPVRWLLRDKFESWRYAPKVTAPTLIVAAEQDEIVPPANAKLLSTRFREGVVAALVTVPGAGHNTVSTTADYVDFLNAGVRD